MALNPGNFYYWEVEHWIERRRHLVEQVRVITITAGEGRGVCGPCFFCFDGVLPCSENEKKIQKDIFEFPRFSCLT